MAAASLVKAYLEWQAEMGTEEVILPTPPARKSSAPPSPAGAAMPGPARPIPFGSGSPGSGPMEDVASPGDSAPAGLLASLSSALEKAGKPFDESGTAALSQRAAAARTSEAHNLPGFGDLEEYWRYLEARPHLLSGEAAPMGASGSSALPHGPLIRSRGPVRAPLGLIGFEPGDEDIENGRAFGGEAGALLEKMMRAIRLETMDLYLGNLIKVRMAGKAWSRRELARILPLLHAELGLAQAHSVLLLGQDCAQAVLKTGKILDELRQETHRMDGREFFVTYHPRELLRQEDLKRKAWADLQWLQRRLAEKQAAV